MKTKPITVIVIGIVLLISGSLLSISSHFKSVFDPGQEAVESIEIDVYYSSYDNEDYDQEEKYDKVWDENSYKYFYVRTVKMDKGEYDLWYEVGFLGLDTPGDVIIEDQNGNIIFEDSPSNNDESVAANFQEYRKMGTLTIPHDGFYNFSSEEEGTFHFTEPTDRSFWKALSIGGGIIAVTGVIVMIVGFVFLFTSEKEKKEKEKI
jgi:uncharacterized membrane protein